ncbi:uncharacterized protein LOC124935771 [Impatiens glandulifera]|uniref:uncharacterized protein LOC124935771 n=1 Tax=Impatiens glandulifera TaxID=253017 RepID=UPI001FB080BE|nr:uncharacterized protein LOC124935771 [Impatiens glandulifera]
MGKRESVEFNGDNPTELVQSSSMQEEDEEAVAKVLPKIEKKILLKRVAKGTAALGMFILVLHHLRRNGRKKTGEVKWRSGIDCRENEKQKAKGNSSQDLVSVLARLCRLGSLGGACSCTMIDLCCFIMRHIEG